MSQSSSPLKTILMIVVAVVATIVAVVIAVRTLRTDDASAEVVKPPFVSE